VIRLQYENLTLRVAGGIVLDSVSLDLRGPGVVVLLGPSGAGKSTLLKATQRLVEHGRDGWVRQGEIYLDGQSVFRGPRRDIARRIGYIQQAPAMLQGSVRDNVEFALRHDGRTPRREVRQLAESALENAGLTGEVPLDRAAATLSGGQQQRLAIARTLALGPDVYLMDEPTSALDPVSSLHIERLIRRLAREQLVVMVTHKVALADRVGDYAGVLLRGEHGSQISEFGRLPSVLRHPTNEGARRFIESGAFVDRREPAPHPILQLTFLFVGTGNSTQTPIAEAVCRNEIARLVGQDAIASARGIQAYSAALAAEDDDPVEPATMRALESMGLAHEARSSRRLTPELVQRADLIFCMTRDQCLALARAYPDDASKIQPLDPIDNLDDDAHEAGPGLRMASRIEELVRWRLQAVSQYPARSVS